MKELLDYTIEELEQAIELKKTLSTIPDENDSSDIWIGIKEELLPYVRDLTYGMAENGIPADGYETMITEIVLTAIYGPKGLEWWNNNL